MFGLCEREFEGSKAESAPRRKVRWEECEQYARVFTVPGFTLDGLFRPQGLLLPCHAEAISAFLFHKYYRSSREVCL